MNLEAIFAVMNTSYAVVKIRPEKNIQSLVVQRANNATVNKTYCAIHLITIYPVDSVIHRLNNRDQACTGLLFYYYHYFRPYFHYSLSRVHYGEDCLQIHKVHRIVIMFDEIKFI